MQEINKQEDNYRINFKINMGSAIYVKKGDISPDLHIKKAQFNGEKQELRLTILNQGKATARPKITWQLSQNNQEIVKGEGGSSFLPQKTGHTLLKPENQENLNLKPGTYQLTGELIWKDGDTQKLPFNVDLEVK